MGAAQPMVLTRNSEANTDELGVDIFNHVSCHCLDIASESDPWSPGRDVMAREA